MTITNFISASMVTAGMMILTIVGCSTPMAKPWNMAPAEEWNSPLEMSWVNLCDNVRNWTAPKGKVWNPVMQNYEPDFSEEAFLLQRDPSKDKR